MQLGRRGRPWVADDWTLIQSLDFSVVTLTTVGYGDLPPASDDARVFTIVYLFVGLGVLVAFTTWVARHYIQHRACVAERAHAPDRSPAPRRAPDEGRPQ